MANTNYSPPIVYKPKRKLKEDRNRVRDVAMDALKYVKYPFAIQFFKSQHETAGIDMTTNIMWLSENLASCPTRFLEFIIGHEVGHPFIFPKNSRWWFYYVEYCKQLKYKGPRDMANVLADLFDNAWNLVIPPWQYSFRREAGKFYKPVDPHASDPKSRWGFLCRMMTQRLYELKYHARKPFIDDLEEIAYEVIFHDDDRPLKDRFEELAVMLSPKFADATDAPQEDQKGRKTLGSNFGKAGKGAPDFQADGTPSPGSQHSFGLPDNMTPEEYADWQKAVQGLGGRGMASMMEAVKNEQPDNMMLLFDLAELNAFHHLMVAEEQGNAPLRAPAGPKVDKLWVPGMNPKDLQIRATLSKSGVIIPGVTTIKRVDGPVKKETSLGKGTLFLIIDTSGSMSNCLASVLIVGWAAVMGAKRRGDKIAAMEFDVKPKYIMPPSYDYYELKKKMEKLQANGGTYLTPAINELVRVCKESGTKPTALIMTDTDIYDGQEQILAALKEVQKIGGKNIVCSPYADHQAQWTKAALTQNLINLFVIDDINNLTRAVKEVHG